MDEVTRQWRPALAMRLACGLIAAFQFALAAAAVAVQVADERVDLVLAVGFVAACVAGFMALEYALRCRITLAGRELTVVNLWRTYRFAVSLVGDARPTRSGIVFVLGDGRRCLANAVQVGRWRLWTGEATPADDVISTVLAAAEQARASGEPAAYPAPEGQTGPADVRRRTWLSARAGIGVLAAGAGLYVGLHHRSALSQDSAHAAPPHAILKVGDCLQDPTSPLGSLIPVACSTPHTAQVYFLTDDITDAAGVTCEAGAPNIGTPFAASSYEKLTYSSGGGSSTTVCIVITPPIGYSLILQASPSP